jgi:hypothetical protein
VAGALACALAAGAQPLATRGPVLVSFHAAAYPPAALSGGREADVPCDLRIAADGSVVVASCEGPDPVFSRAARDSLLQARFSPASRNGVPIPAQIQFVYRFALAAVRLPEPPEMAASATVAGEVLAGGVRLSIPGADVIAQGVGVAATSDAHGRFALKLPPGHHVLVASAPEYAPEQIETDVAADGRAEIRFHLRRVSVADLSAVVPGERNRQGPTRETIVREELRNVPGSQDDPIRVVENLPGLARIPFSGGQLIVRGAQPQDTGAFIDGQRIPVLYHLLQGPSVVGEESVDRIDFYPGGAGVYFGRTLSGVVNVTSRRGDPERLHGSLAADLNKSSAFLQGPLGESTQFAVGGRRSYVNPIVQFMLRPGEEVSLPVYWDYQARVDHRFSDRDHGTLLVFGSGDSVDVVGATRGSVPLLSGRSISFHRARLSWDRRVSDRLSFTVEPVAGWDVSDESDSGLGAGALARPQRSHETTLSAGLRAGAVYRARPELELRTGIDASLDRISYTLDQLYDQQLRSLGAPNAEETKLVGVKSFRGIGTFAESELRLGRFRFTPGLRIETLGWTGRTFVAFDPRVWVRFLADDSTTFHAYAGLYHQSPTAEQLDPLAGNPRLLPERAEQYGVGVERKIGPLWTIRAEGYLNRRSSLVFPAEARANGDGTYDNPLQLNSGIARSYGLELLVRRELSARVYGWIAYSLSKSRELARPGAAWQPTIYDQPHILTLLVGYRPSPYVELSGRFRLASGNPVSAAQSAVFNADSGTYTPTLLPFGAVRLPTFIQLDFELNNIWAADDYRFSLYVDFENVLGRRNSEQLVYDYRYAASDTVHGTPLLATIGGRLSF